MNMHPCPSLSLFERWTPLQKKKYDQPPNFISKSSVQKSKNWQCPTCSKNSWTWWFWHWRNESYIKTTFEMFTLKHYFHLKHMNKRTNKVIELKLTKKTTKPVQRKIMVNLLNQRTTRKIQMQIMLSKNTMCLKKGRNSLNNIQKHFMYSITCENNNKVYIGQNIVPYKWFKQHMHRPRKKMKHDINMSKTINLTFKLIILYSNMHKYKADRMENLYIQYFNSTSKTCYNNLKGKPTSFKKY